MTERDPRTAAEWTTLATASIVLAVLVGLIAAQLTSPRDPAAPVAELDGQHEEHGFHHVDVVVTNHGDETAANVQVTAELTIDGEVTEADQMIDFLAGGEEEELVFIFEDDPADGELRVSVSGFGVP